MFYGRTTQLEELNQKFDFGTKQLIIIYGRRRIGKTEMVKEFLKGKKGISFQAVEGGEKANLIALEHAYAEALGLSEEPNFKSWERALGAVKRHYSGERYYFVIDEYPFIVDNFPEFPSILQAFYDNSGDNLFLVVLGSDVSFLKKEITDKKSPLYKRKTCEIRLEKMSFSEALLFLDGLSTEDKCRYMSLMSSYPFYLSAINKEKNFDENVVDLLFKESGMFAQLPDVLLSNSTQMQDAFDTVLQSIARTHCTQKDICEDTGMSEDDVSYCLHTLLDSEIIEKKLWFMNEKNRYYIIADPLLRFWYTFIFPNRELIHFNAVTTYESNRTTIRDNFLCHAFEDMARLYLEELNATGRLGETYGRFQKFETSKSSLGREVEIDGLAKSKTTLIVIECKYRKDPFDNAMMERMRENVSFLYPKLRRQYYIFSKSGFAKNFDYASDVHCFVPEDMFKIADEKTQ